MLYLNMYMTKHIITLTNYDNTRFHCFQSSKDILTVMDLEPQPLQTLSTVHLHRSVAPPLCLR